MIPHGNRKRKAYLVLSTAKEAMEAYEWKTQRMLCACCIFRIFREMQDFKGERWATLITVYFWIHERQVLHYLKLLSFHTRMNLDNVWYCTTLNLDIYKLISRLHYKYTKSMVFSRLTELSFSYR